MTDSITFTVPDWARDRHIYVFAGVELLADYQVRIVHRDGEHVPVRQPLRIKTDGGRCNGCGSCCSSSSISQDMLNEMKICLDNQTGEGCPFLGEDGCIMRAWIPFSCAKSVCSAYEGCTEELVVQ